MYPYLTKIFIGIISIAGLVVLGNSYLIHKFSKKYSEEVSDVIIVLGTRIENGKVSPLFKERINQGILLYQNGKAPYILFTGGQGKGQLETESAVAKKFAIDNGVPAEAIILDEKAKSTFQNLKYSKKIMYSMGFKKALLVSDPYPIKRAMAFAQHFNLTAQPSPTQTSIIKGFIPKSIALVYETFFYMLGQGIIVFNRES